ncbi:excinuclease ABC subunit UvrC [Prochlorococcus sp. MIT 1307]|uniref:excinuclease ABC subunit UvrC n=1 Tax=Prochlorococcus sp. MIT 1307 TaxID=3096219 RepID=UPI0039BF5D4D
MSQINKVQILLNNQQRLNERLGLIPNEPGCYLMLDSEERLLYVGKSKNLKNRVRSYFHRNNEHSPRIKLMIRQIAEIEFIVTDNEAEALTLESNLIKNKQPYFNILLKDDKKYPYLCITWSEEYPRIYITRRRRKRNQLDRYYGPYVDVGLLRRTLFLVKRVFPLRQRPQPLYKDRTCLNYSIGRCPGVCQQKISSEKYHQTLKKVAMVFQGRSDELIKKLTINMYKYSNRMEYEKAAQVRDQINGIEKIGEDQKMILPDSSISRDVIALAKDDRIASIQIFQVRSGKLVGRLGYISNEIDLDNEIILQRIIEEHYCLVDSVEIPNQIHLQYPLIQQKLITDWLSETKGRNVKLFCPKRSKNSEFIDLVKRNASHELIRIQKGHQKQELATSDLASLLEIDFLPRRIEGYDISHIQGSDAVASQVVFIDGLPARQHYRKYKIKSHIIKTGHSDDYLSLAEVIERRFKKWSRLKKELGSIELKQKTHSSSLENSVFNDWPDLIMIDGGKGQLNAVINRLRRLDLENEITICSLAKKNEEVYVPNRSDPLKAEPDQLGLLLLRRLRDEAHRFAINFHRQQRGSRMKRSTLSQIPGIGPKRIGVLLTHFQSIDAIQMASLEQLSKAPGVGNQLALEVWNYFHPEHESNS